MKNFLCTVLFLPMAMMSQTSHATVVNFDDLVLNASGVLNVPDNYGGFIWGPTAGNPRFFAISDTTYTSAGNYANSYGSPSGENAVSNYAGDVIVYLANGASFDFNGAHFSPFTIRDLFQSDTATSLTVAGYNGATLVGTASINFPGIGYSWLQADLRGVTSLKFIGSIGNTQPAQTGWLMDNFTFNETAQAIPEPPTFWLVGAALLGLFGYFGVKRKGAAQAAGPD